MFTVLFQIDGSEEFTYHVPTYGPMNMQGLKMVYYDESMKRESVMVVVHVTEHLTGIQLLFLEKFLCNLPKNSHRFP